MKPLFLPLKTKYYDDFLSGDKGDELRRYGPRWNEKTCPVGREVLLSKGYGKKNRTTGRIWKFRKQHGTMFASAYSQAILDVYGTLDIWIAVISINNLAAARLSGTTKE